MAMQKLQPKVKEVQNRYKNDQEKAQLEVARLYREAQVPSSRMSHLIPPIGPDRCSDIAYQESTAGWLSCSCASQVNPLAGCLPTLATIPVFIGLYRWDAAPLACKPAACSPASEQLFAPVHSEHLHSPHLLQCQVQSPVKCCGRGAANRGLLLDPFAGGPDHAGCSESGAHRLKLRQMFIVGGPTAHQHKQSSVMSGRPRRY
jgi:hypothetical protein